MILEKASTKDKIFYELGEYKLDYLEDGLEIHYSDKDDNYILILNNTIYQDNTLDILKSKESDTIKDFIRQALKDKKIITNRKVINKEIEHYSGGYKLINVKLPIEIHDYLKGNGHNMTQFIITATKEKLSGLTNSQ